jgi:hypothetical protein
MAEYEVLHGEPRYKVDTLVGEVLERTRRVITEMGPRLEGLLRDMIEQFHSFRARNYLITFDDVHFAQARHMQDGHILIDFLIGEHEPAPDFLRHAVIDAWVDDVVQRHVPESLRNEFSGFMRGTITQFAALTKHAPVSLRAFTFDRIEWAGERTLSIAIKYRGEPFTPQTVRW